MTQKQMELLDAVIEERLNASLDKTDPQSHADFSEAMEAIDQRLKIEEFNASMEEHEDDKKSDVKKSRINTILKVVEIAAVPIALTTIGIVSRNRFATRMCNFEKDYTFTTSAGRSLKDVFRWKH